MSPTQLISLSELISYQHLIPSKSRHHIPGHHLRYSMPHELIPPRVIFFPYVWPLLPWHEDSGEKDADSRERDLPCHGSWRPSSLGPDNLLESPLDYGHLLKLPVGHGDLLNSLLEDRNLHKPPLGHGELLNILVSSLLLDLQTALLTRTLSMCHPRLVLLSKGYSVYFVPQI
ncbi:hypothetical protein CEXT_11631 [Caerostris extrusa]|uniref:Uncharacterized protein n=1 Tax=Caerostris extrusa TaxID=172846 RepID=A0AAV4XC66_CAEEX|nr:hypothetical protein CEXT_11631 [Caerostris extrusa]